MRSTFIVAHVGLSYTFYKGRVLSAIRTPQRAFFLDSCGNLQCVTQFPFRLELACHAGSEVNSHLREAFPVRMTCHDTLYIQRASCAMLLCAFYPE